MHNVLANSFLRGGWGDLVVDPVVSQHFLVTEVEVAASKQGEAHTRIWRRMADALAAIRLATMSPVSIVAPTQIRITRAVPG